MGYVPVLGELIAEFRDARPDIDKLTAEEAANAFIDFHNEHAGITAEIVSDGEHHWVRVGIVEVDWTREGEWTRRKLVKRGRRMRSPAGPEGWESYQARPFVWWDVKPGDLVALPNSGHGTLGRLCDDILFSDGSWWAHVADVRDPNKMMNEDEGVASDYYLEEMRKVDVCPACKMPRGTGTLLDFQPKVPYAGRKMGFPLKDWRRFAKRYRCPVCADAVPRKPR